MLAMPLAKGGGANSLLLEFGASALLSRRRIHLQGDVAEDAGERFRRRCGGGLQLAFSSPLASSEHSMRSSDLRQTRAPDAQMPIPTSVVFRQLLEEVPSNHFTLDWLLGRLGKRSFGIIMLLLAVVAIAPGVSIFAGLLLFIPAISE